MGKSSVGVKRHQTFNPDINSHELAAKMKTLRSLTTTRLGALLLVALFFLAGTVQGAQDVRKCKWCPRTFPSQSRLAKHERTCKQTKSEEKAEPGNVTAGAATPTST